MEAIQPQDVAMVPGRIFGPRGGVGGVGVLYLRDHWEVDTNGIKSQSLKETRIGTMFFTEIMILLIVSTTCL